jgi:hypothetical protein
VHVRAARVLAPLYNPVIHATGVHVQSIGKSTDTIATLLQQLASPQILDVLNRIEQPRLAQDPAVIDRLLHTAITAAAQHDHPGAVASMRELITIHPERGAALIHEPALAPIRHELKEMLQQMAGTAKMEAEHALAAATLAAQTAGPTPYIENVLAIAQRFIAAGELVNFVRATELTRTVLNDHGIPVPPKKATLQRLTSVLRRAPLLVVMLAWLLVGIAGWLMDLKGGEIWALGFLALVGFQFYTSIRNARF